MYLWEYGIIWDTPSGTHIVYGYNKDQYGPISQGSIKLQAKCHQENSLCVDHMYGKDTDIPLDAIDRDSIKETLKERQDKYTDTNPYTSRFEEDNYSEGMLIVSEASRKKHHGYPSQI